MGYECIVLAKQVADARNITGEAMKADGTVNRSALPAIFNPEDLNSLEMALRVRDEHGGRVTVVTPWGRSWCSCSLDRTFVEVSDA